MVPLSGLAILGFFFIVPFLDDGPLLNPILLKELKYCTSNWWTNMLAMQNVINPGEMVRHNETITIPTYFRLPLINNYCDVGMGKGPEIGISEHHLYTLPHH